MQPQKSRHNIERSEQEFGRVIKERGRLPFCSALTGMVSIAGAVPLLGPVGGGWATDRPCYLLSLTFGRVATQPTQTSRTLLYLEALSRQNPNPNLESVLI